MLVKFVSDWHGISAGDIIELNDGVALIHIERGRAVRHTARKRGRPRKNKDADQTQTADSKGGDVHDSNG